MPLPRVDRPERISPQPADDFNAASKEIQQAFKGLGYSDDSDIDLVQNG